MNVYYHGYHNDDPQQIFRSSLSLDRVLEDPFDLPPVIVCYKLNGQWLSAKRGGPVRIVRENGKKVRDFEGDTKNTCALALSGDGKLMAAGGLDGILHIQVPETGKLVVSFEPPVPKTPAQGD